MNLIQEGTDASSIYANRKIFIVQLKITSTMITLVKMFLSKYRQNIAYRCARKVSKFEPPDKARMQVL